MTDRININLLVKQFGVLITSVVALYLYLMSVTSNLGIITLYEKMIISSLFDISLIFDIERVLFFPVFLLLIHRDIKLRTFTLLLPIAALIVMSANIYHQLILIYLSCILKKDGVARSSYLIVGLLVTLFSLVGKKLGLNIVEYIPFVIVLGRSLLKRYSLTMDILFLFLVHMISREYIQEAFIFKDIFFSLIILLTVISRKRSDVLLYTSMWSAVSLLPSYWSIIIFLMYFVSSKELKLKDFAISLYKPISLLILVLFITTTRNNDLVILIPLLALILNFNIFRGNELEGEINV